LPPFSKFALLLILNSDGLRGRPRKLLEEIINRLVHCLQPEKIILFGSHAYGKPAEISDIVFEKTHNLVALLAFCIPLEPRFSRLEEAAEILTPLRHGVSLSG